MATGTYISIITLNVNGLNAPTKRYRLVEWIQKQDPYIGCLQKTHFRPKDTYRHKDTYRLAEWLQKQDPYICCLQKTHFRPKDT